MYTISDITVCTQSNYQKEDNRKICRIFSKQTSVIFQIIILLILSYFIHFSALIMHRFPAGSNSHVSCLSVNSR